MTVCMNERSWVDDQARIDDEAPLVLLPVGALDRSALSLSGCLA